MDKATFRKILFLISFTLVCYLGALNITGIFSFIQSIYSLLLPVLEAFVLAYLLNIPMRGFERYLFDQPIYLPKEHRKKLPSYLYKFKRPVSMLLSITVLLIILYVLFGVVLPQFLKAATNFFTTLPSSLIALREKALKIFEDKPLVLQVINEFSARIQDYLLNLQSIFTPNELINTLNSGIGIITVIGSRITNTFIVLIMAIYIVSSKELLARQGKQFCIAFFSESLLEKNILPLLRLVDKSFSSYLSGQFLDSCVLGLMFMGSMLLFNIPYVLLIGIFVICCGMIPYIGAFISGGTGFLIILTVNPTKALLFIIVAFVCQQIEANFIYPIIVGRSVKMPAIWVLISLSIGASLAGILGVIVSIPIFSVIYTLVGAAVRRRLYNEAKYHPFSARASAMIFQRMTRNFHWDEDISSAELAISELEHQEEEEHLKQEESKKRFTQDVKRILKLKNKSRKEEDIEEQQDKT